MSDAQNKQAIDQMQSQNVRKFRTIKEKREQNMVEVMNLFRGVNERLDRIEEKMREWDEDES